MVQKVAEGRESEFGRCHLTNEIDFVSTPKLMSTSFESGKDKAAKVEEWAAPHISRA